MRLHLSLLLACGVIVASGFRLTPATTSPAACAAMRRPARAVSISTEAARTFAPVLMADDGKDDEEGWTIDKVAKLGLAGVISIAVAETVFWVLSFPVSAIVYYIATGEWIDLFTQDGQVKFLAFTAGWGALGGAIAQYRTVLTVAPWLKSVPSALSKARQWLRRLSWFLLTLQRALGRLEACGGPSYSPQLAPEGGPLSSHHQAAAMTPWMDRNVVQPYLTPLIEKNKGD
eukprot:Transcript_17605.p4 GENE.Transcript_17605~~Transcript_17605.p4  ORF type:complete len:231 (-),score=50.05 Transcript_17605:118-810(-)